MAYYKVKGGNKLNGTVSVSGAKNAAVAIIPAVILCGAECTLKNIPDIEDVRILIKLLKSVNAKVDFNTKDNILKIDSSTITKDDCEMIDPVMRDLRASYYFLGAMLGRFGTAYIKLPGGCAIGERPIDLHIMGIKALDVSIDEDTMNETVRATANRKDGQLYCSSRLIYLPKKSVGATINIMIAASKIKYGEVVINNAAKEPHVVDVANFLNAMGADVTGAGTDNITIKPARRWHGCTYEIIPDQIETGTFMLAAAAAGGSVTVKNVIPKHMESLTQALKNCGVSVCQSWDGERDCLVVESDGANSLNSIMVETAPYPGFPTDLQQPLVAMLSCAKGQSYVRETIFESRFVYIKQLIAMGAVIRVDDRLACVEGQKKLKGSNVAITDLRAGAALVVAALMADGVSHISNIHFLDRGYEHFDEKFRSIGADIERVEE